jgi:transposase-like protein
VWCFYAALLSVIIYWQFNRGNIDIATPNGRSAELRPYLFSWLRRTRTAVEAQTAAILAKIQAEAN